MSHLSVSDTWMRFNVKRTYLALLHFLRYRMRWTQGIFFYDVIRGHPLVITMPRGYTNFKMAAITSYVKWDFRQNSNLVKNGQIFAKLIHRYICKPWVILCYVPFSKQIQDGRDDAIKTFGMAFKRNATNVGICDIGSIQNHVFFDLYLFSSMYIAR